MQNISPLQLYKLLADDTRLRCVLLILSEGELCVCELMVAIDEVQPKISRHLAQIREAGILETRRQGQWMFYRIAGDLPAWIRSILQTTAEANSDYTRINLALLNRMGDRPQRAIDCCT